MAGTKEGAAKRKAALQVRKSVLDTPVASDPIPYQVPGDVKKAETVHEVSETPAEPQEPAEALDSPVYVAWDGPVYVVGPKRALVHEGKRLEAGEVVPGAHLWPRIESWLNTGRIVLRERVDV